MNINDLEIDEMGLICVINVQLDESQKALYKLMQMGIVEGLEVRKVGEVATCAEYQIEGIAGRLVISKELGDYINICKLDDID
jgi:Fe2+ transport system protein FeoA